MADEIPPIEWDKEIMPLEFTLNPEEAKEIDERLFFPKRLIQDYLSVTTVQWDEGLGGQHRVFRDLSQPEPYTVIEMPLPEDGIFRNSAGEPLEPQPEIDWAGTTFRNTPWKPKLDPEPDIVVEDKYNGRSKG